MPETDGYEVIKILKSNPETKDIPVILLFETADSSSAEETCRALGVTDHISKPLDPVTLLACVNKVVH
jgi:putative two-component system response regulator